MKQLCYWLLSLFIFAGAVYHYNAKAETAIHAGGYSYHVATGHEHEYNDWHRLAAVEHGSYMAGYFRNSYDRDTFVAGYGWSKQWGEFRGSVHVGATYGYRSCYGDEGDKARVCPVAFPSLYWTRYQVQPGVLILGNAIAITARIEL